MGRAAALNDSGVKGPGGTIAGVVPARTERTTTCSPAMWCGGRARSHLPGLLSRAWVASAEACSASAERATIFGSPDEPEVAMSAAAFAGGAASDRRGAKGGQVARAGGRLAPRPER